MCEGEREYSGYRLSIRFSGCSGCSGVSPLSNEVFMVLTVLRREHDKHDKQEGFPLYKAGVAFPARETFVFNSKFYFGNKMKVG